MSTILAMFIGIALSVVRGGAQGVAVVDEGRLLKETGENLLLEDGTSFLLKN